MTVKDQLIQVAENTPKVYEAGYNKAIDKFCPDFTVSGSAVSCAPVEGYPVKVVSTLPERDAGYTEISFKQGGKNLYDENDYPLKRGHYVKQSVYKNDMCSCVEKFIPVSHLRGLKITISHVAPLNQPGLYFYTSADGNTVIQPDSQAGWKGPTFTVPDNASYMRFTVPVECADIRCVQIELGEVSTDYEPFTPPDVHSVSFPQISGGTFDWNTGILIDMDGNVNHVAAYDIAGKPGVNTFISGDGTVQVSGKADPIAVINNVTNAVLYMDEM